MATPKIRKKNFIFREPKKVNVCATPLPTIWIEKINYEHHPSLEESIDITFS